MIGLIAYLNLAERFSRESAREIADGNVSSPYFDGAVGLEFGDPMQPLALEKSDELLGSKPVVEQHAVDFKSAPESVFHQFLGQLDFGLERDARFSAPILLHIQPQVERMTLPMWVDEFCGDDVVSQDVSFLAVVPVNPNPFDLFPGLMGEGIVNGQPSLACESPLALEQVDSRIIDLVLFPDSGGEESVEGTRMPSLDENPVDPLHRQVFRDDQSKHIALEMLERGCPEVWAESFESLFEVPWELCDDGHGALPTLGWHSIAASCRALQALIQSPTTFLFIHSASRSPCAANYCAIV